jgi:uroporphyrinogen decarboxylase
MNNKKQMTSRERVLTIFDHQEPDRVPMWCGASEEFWVKAKIVTGLGDEELRIRFHDDFRRVFAPYNGNKEPLAQGIIYRTPFGIDRRGQGYGQPVNHPLAEATVTQINDYPWPDACDVDVSNIKADAKYYNRQYAILGGDWSPFWHDAIDFLGMENLFVRMYLEPEAVDAVFEHLVDYYIASSKRIFDAAGDEIDIFFIGNDFGSQTGPLIDEGLFRRFVLPHLKRLIDLGHSYGLKVMMHSCGGFAQLIPSLIEVGLDSLHAIQTSCCGMDLQTLKSQFGDKIVFNGGIDSHHILIEGNPEYVRLKTREILNIMMPGGGYIAGASHDTILEETPVENVLAMFDTIKEYGVYK